MTTIALLAASIIVASWLIVTQEVITILVFLVFAWLYLGERIRWNEAVAFGFVLGAVVFASLPV